MNPTPTVSEVILELIFDTTTSPAPVSAYALAGDLLEPCKEAAAVPDPAERFEMKMVEVEPKDKSLGLLWTGALQFMVRNSAALGNLCRGLCIGLRAALERKRTSFELEVKVGANSVRLKVEDIRACLGKENEVKVFRELLTKAVQALGSLPPA